MDKLVEKLVFGRSGLNSSVFEKLLISYSCISFMKYYALRSFLHKIALFFKNLFFPDFWSIESVSRSIKIAIKIFGFGLQLMFDRFSIDRNWKIFSFYVLDQFFFYASFMFRIHMHYIIFVSILQFCNHVSHCFHTWHAYTLLYWVLNLIKKLID